MNEVDDLGLLEKFTKDFCEIVEKYCDYVVVSGFLAISSGRSRGTEDIDIIIPRISFELFKKLHTELKSKFSLFNLEGLPVEEVFSYLENNSNIRYVYHGTVIPNMEVKFAKNEVDIDNLFNRKKISLTGQDIYFAPIECAIAYKEYLGSNKDLEDALHLKKIYEEEISTDQLSKYRKLIERCFKDG